jgi:hypothetical protein
MTKTFTVGLLLLRLVELKPVVERKRVVYMMLTSRYLSVQHLLCRDSSTVNRQPLKRRTLEM